MSALTSWKSKEEEKEKTQDGARQQFACLFATPPSALRSEGTSDTRGPQWPTIPRSTKAERETREKEPGTSPLCGGPLTLPLFLPIPTTYPPRIESTMTNGKVKKRGKRRRGGGSEGRRKMGRERSVRALTRGRRERVRQGGQRANGRSKGRVRRPTKRDTPTRHSHTTGPGGCGMPLGYATSGTTFRRHF